MHIPPNDPLRLLIPILHQCKDDLREAQQETLQLFQSALEEEHAKWSKESLARAEMIVSAGLTSVHDTAVTMFKQAQHFVILPVMSGHRVKRVEVLQTPWG